MRQVIFNSERPAHAARRRVNKLLHGVDTASRVGIRSAHRYSPPSATEMAALLTRVGSLVTREG